MANCIAKLNLNRDQELSFKKQIGIEKGANKGMTDVQASLNVADDAIDKLNEERDQLLATAVRLFKETDTYKRKLKAFNAGQANSNHGKNEATKPEIDNANNTGTKTNASDTTSEADNQSGISDEQQKQPEQDGTSSSNIGIRAGQGQSDAVNSSESQGNEVSGNEGLVGYTASGGDQQVIGQSDSENGSVPKHLGADNYSLIDKPNIALTPAKRRDINILVAEILKKPVNDITEDDKEVLRQYTGNGGLDLKASEDKGAGIFNQHYTAYDTIKAMYGALVDAGIKMVNNLEPSVGSGNFVGMFPHANWTVIDIDKTNTEVVERLYPDAKVFNESYETFRGKNFDLIISNVPFASFSSLAREHAGTIKPAFKAIHNFFFAHSIDKLKTGGVMAFMTSTGTMDGTVEAQKLREHIVKQMDVIGAYRLPMGTQKANASTEVMIDVIFLQKRPEGVASKQPEKNQSFVDVANKEGYKINQYFVDYPESVLGDLSIGKNKTSMGKVGWIVTGDADYSRMKIEPQDYTATKKIEQGEFTNQESAKEYADNHGLEFIDGETKPFFKDGVIYDKPVSYSDVSGGGLFGRKATGVNADKLTALKNIDETHDAELVHQYEEKYSKSPHIDKSLALWAKANYAEQQLKSYLALFDKYFNLSEIFTKQVRFEDSGKIEIDEYSPLLDRAESLEDADGIFSTKTDLISSDDVQELLDNGDYAKLANGSLQNSRLYYAGNIYKKLDDADKVKPAAQRDKQIAKLERVKPALITIKNISITGKESWLPDSAIASIGRNIYQDGTVIIGHNAISDNHLLHLFNQYLNNDSLVSKGKDETPEEYADKLKSAQNILHNDILPLIKQKLLDDGLTDEIVVSYNKAKNFFSSPIFNGLSLKNIPTMFKGQIFKLLLHQQEGIERAIYNKKGVLAFAPGLGKTPAAIIVADQLLQKGVMKKPLFIVPANTIPQWEASARSLYPNAKIYEFPKFTSGINKGKVKEWPNMTKSDKEKMVYDLTNNRYDFTFISTNLAQKFAVPMDKLSQYLDDLTESISGMEEDDADLTKAQIKAKETRLAKIRMLKATMMAAYRESSILGFDMGKMGFDALFADEVQYYKNIGMQSEDAKGGIGASVAITAKYPLDADGKQDKTQDPLSVTLGSSRSYDFRFKTQFISENNNGNNVFLLTGTPTPNKPLELMTLLHHLDTHILDEYGINNVGEFVDEFLDIQAVEEMAIDGTNKLKPQLVGIKNIFGLKKIISRFIDYRSPESASDLTRPTQINKTHIVLQNQDAEAIFADIQIRILQSIEDSKAKMSGDKEVVVEPMIKMYGAGRDGSIDVRLYTPSNDDKGDIRPGTVFQKETRAEYSKIAKTVELVAAKNKLDPEAGQLIFLDRLKFSDGSGSTHEDIRNDILKATGLKPNEVVFVNGGEYVNPNTGKIAKNIKQPMLQTIMDDYNAGKIKVLIGNTSKLGVGVDLQVTTTDIYQIDKPYRPDEIEQRNNRGVRQGNRNSEVTVHTFNQPGTFDAMSDRIIANKQGFNDVFWKDQESDRADVKGEEAPGHYDAAIELEQNPIKKRKLEIERDLQQASSKTNHLEKQISTLAKRIRTATENILAYENANKGIENRETPKYEDQNEADRKNSIIAFKKRMADQHALNVTRIADIKIDLVEFEDHKATRVSELDSHKSHIANIRDQFVVNGVVNLDAIERSGQSKSETPTNEAEETLQSKIDNLNEDDTANLEDHYGLDSSSSEFHDAVKNDVISFVNKGASSIASAIRHIIRLLAAGILASCSVFSPATLSTDNAFNVPQLIEQTVAAKPLVAPKEAQLSAIANDTYTIMAPAFIKAKSMFFIADKPNGKTHLFGKNGEHIASTNTLFGKQSGDVLDEKRMNTPTDDLLETDKITPAGIFKIKVIADANYTGGYILDFQKNGVPQGGIALHSVWTGNKKEHRVDRLNSPEVTDNKVSFGCVNVSEAFFKNNILPHVDDFNNAGVVVIPDDANLAKYGIKEGTALFSKSEGKASNPHNAITLRSAIAKAVDSAFGSGWMTRLESTGKFKIIGRDEALRIAGNSAINAKGFYDPKTDTTYIVSDNISQEAKPSELVSLLLHEISTHALQLGKSNEEFQALLSKFEGMQKHNPKVKEAFARVPKDTKEEHIVEEALAYFLENNPSSTIAQRIIEAFRQMVRAIGNTLIGKDKFLFSQWANKLTEAEIQGMAVSALRNAPESLMFDNVGRNDDSIKLAKELKTKILAYKDFISCLSV